MNRMENFDEIKIFANRAHNFAFIFHTVHWHLKSEVHNDFNSAINVKDNNSRNYESLHLPLDLRWTNLPEICFCLKFLQLIATSATKIPLTTSGHGRIEK